MELGINRAIDDSGLEAGVGVAKLYCGCHIGDIYRNNRPRELEC
jgi:hypothetical protein